MSGAGDVAEELLRGTRKKAFELDERGEGDDGDVRGLRRCYGLVERWMVAIERRDPASQDNGHGLMVAVVEGKVALAARATFIAPDAHLTSAVI